MSAGGGLGLEPSTMTVALVALGVGVPAALFALWPLLGRRVAAGAGADDEERLALETEKLEALRVLRELGLDREAGHLDEADYQDLRAKAEARAAAILRRLDRLRPPVPPARARPPAPPAPVPWSRQPVVLGAAGIGVLVFGVTLGILLTRYTTPVPGDPPAAAGPPPMGTGPGAPAGAAGAGAAPRPIPKEVLQGMLQAAHQSLDAGRYGEAIAAYKAVLRREPRNVEAITHLGVILAIAGHADNALEAFDKALAIDPDYAHALWDKAGVLYETKHDYAGAVRAWERFVRVAPSPADRDQALGKIKEARARLGAAAGPAAAPRGDPAGTTPAPQVR